MQSTVQTTAAVTPEKSPAMIPGVGTTTHETYDDQLSTLPEEASEEDGPDEHRNSDVALLADNDAERFHDADDEISAFEGNIARSELGDDDDANNDNTLIPSVVFMIPFPAPVNGQRSKKTTPFLLYTPPRSVYSKPPKDENGKRGKEKLPKRLVRHYQQEVRFGEKIKRREIPKTGRFYKLQKVRGACIRGASMLTKWLPSPCIETLARIPPKRKLGEIIVIFPTNAGKPRPEGQDQPYQPTAEELRHDINVLLRRTRRRVLVRLVIACALMPIAAGIDFFAPAFSVEITLAYLAFQVYGWRKVKALTTAPKKKKAKKSKKSKKDMIENTPTEGTAAPGELINGDANAVGEDNDPALRYGADLFRIIPGDQAIFDPLHRLMYDICHRIDPLTFPSLQEEATVIDGPREETQPETSDNQRTNRTRLPPTLHKPGPEVVRELMAAFRANLPEHIQERHILDDERVSEDLARYMKKAASEYVWSLKGRPERSPHKITKKWFAKRKTVHQERKARRKVKQQIKKEMAEDLLNPSPELDPSTSAIPIETSSPTNPLPEQEPSEAASPVGTSSPALTELPPVHPEVEPSEVESPQDKKQRLAKEKAKAKETKRKEKAEVREQAKQAKRAKQQAKKEQSKVERPMYLSF